MFSSGWPHTQNLLVLFDIDGTLVDCGSAAGKCFSTAFRKVFRIPCPKFSGREISGLTDAAILTLVLRRAQVIDDSAEPRQEVLALYADELANRFASNPPRALSGAREAVEKVRSLTGCVPGLLTGSTLATAKIKLEFAGIDFGQFVCGAFSDDGEHRELLPPVARLRFTQRLGLDPDLTILVGDTPRDGQAAEATGCAFVGVATGHYDAATLFAAGARVVFPDLSDTRSFCEAISALTVR